MRYWEKDTYTVVNNYGEPVHTLKRGDLLPRFVNDRELRWFAFGWGIDPKLPRKELEREVWAENGRRSPCRDCGGEHPGSIDPWRCDRCFMAHVVDQMRQRELRELNREIRLRRRREARLMASKLSVGRRQLVDLAGLDDPDEVFYEAFSEVA